jgi:ABC-2 type transport system permease protein
MRRYALLVWIQLRASLATAMQYRINFVIDGVMSLWWMVWTLVPLWVVFRGRDAVAGWTFPEALLVAAWFTVLRGVLEGAINPSLVETGDKIRTGTLDFVLMKPADGQFLISTSKFQPWKVFDVGAGVVMFVIAFQQLGRVPAVSDIALALLLLGAAVLTMYSLWVLVVCAAFWVVRLDNLAYLLGSIFDAARWPIDVFRGAWRVIFTFIIPLGLMTTYPARAILGNMDGRTAVFALAGALAIAAFARAIWKTALRRYTSASS